MYGEITSLDSVLVLHPTLPPSSPRQDHVLVSGWQWMVLVRGDDGSTAASLRHACQPVAPPVVADFTNDGLNDIIITCSEGYVTRLTVEPSLSGHLWHFVQYSKVSLSQGLLFI